MHHTVEQQHLLDRIACVLKATKLSNWLSAFNQKTNNSAVYVVVSMHMTYRIQLSVISSSLCNRSWPHNIVTGGEAGRNRSHFVTLVWLKSTVSQRLALLQASVCPNTIWFFVSWHLGNQMYLARGQIQLWYHSYPEAFADFLHPRLISLIKMKYPIYWIMLAM